MRAQVIHQLLGIDKIWHTDHPRENDELPEILGISSSITAVTELNPAFALAFPDDRSNHA